MIASVLKSKSTTTIVEIANSRLLQLVAGPEDAHINAIQDGFDVVIRNVDTGLSVTGKKADVTAAEGIFKQMLLDARDRNHKMDLGYVKGLIAHSAGTHSETISTRKKTLRARTPAQSQYIKLLNKYDLVFGVGPAGTGKTYLGTAFAAAMLEAGKVERIILSRPAVEAGERLGFLPGDMKDKVDPYLRPLYDALHDVLDLETVAKHLESGVIEIAPLAFMRGRTLTNAAVLLDEAQNTTTMQMKMFLTRLGEGSKMIITGDPTQVDLPSNVTSGLRDALTVLKGDDEIGVIEFEAKDVVRRALVGKIVAAYERHHTHTIKAP